MKILLKKLVRSWSKDGQKLPKRWTNRRVKDGQMLVKSWTGFFYPQITQIDADFGEGLD
jgi:hypothetical protein